jgi:sugar/nucleoside kinase (ribokinase family)
VGKPSRGVVVAGGLSFDRVRARRDLASGADGSALRAAVGAWLVGVETAVCAVIGSDFPTELIVGVTRAGVDLSRVRLAPDPAAVAGADLEPLPEQLASISPRWSVHLCGLSTARQREIIRAVNLRSPVITLDTVHLSGKIAPAAHDILELAANSDAFFAGRNEAAQLWPGQSHRELLHMLAGRGVGTAVIKLGAGGSIGIREGTITSVPAYPVTPSGLTGGGDAYGGAFAATFSSDRDLPRAMAWASAASSVVLESFATLDSLTEFGRSKVEYRARILEAEARNGWAFSAGDPLPAARRQPGRPAALPASP